MQSSLELNAIKLALKKNNDIDLEKITSEYEKFNYFPQEEFKSDDKVLVIGASNLRNLEKLAETVTKEGKVIILENNEQLMTRATELIEELKKEKGYKNWEIHYCYWDNMQVNSKLLNNYLEENPISEISDYENLQKYLKLQCESKPIIREGWADVVYINGINRFTSEVTSKVVSQAFLLAGRYGKVLLDIILADEKLTKQASPLSNGLELRNILKEEEIVDLLTSNDFHGISYAWRAEIPIKIIDRVELRPYLVKAYKGKQGICKEKGHAVFYSGPWKEVIDDDGHKLVRGQRMAVCEKTYKLLTSAPYDNEVVGVEPYFMVSEEEAPLFDCSIRPVRDPRITKGLIEINSDMADDNIKESKCC